MTIATTECPTRRWPRRPCWVPRFVTSLGLILALGRPGIAPGQDSRGPAPGTRVQVWAPDRIDGTLLRITSTTLVIQPDHASQTEVPLSAIRELRTPGRPRGRAVGGAVIGFVGGMLVGGAAGAVAGGGLGALVFSQIRSPAFERRSLREIRLDPLPGTWVRITANGNRTQGTVLTFGADSVALEASGRLSSIRRAAISKLEWPVGRDRLGRSGFLTGAAIGGAAGAVVGLAVGSECRTSDHFFCGGGGVGGYAVALGLVGAASVGLVGLAIGHGISRTRWESATPETGRISVVPMLLPGRVGLAGAIRF